ncbi:MAG: hypothetical protein FD138_1526 [Planctomycetota bacterium]|nr:MAG: hypothetical protein FD138_1526 [Planctomycetota bacterium]
MLEMLVATMLIQAVAFGWYGVARLTRSVRHTSLTSAAAWAAWFQTTLTITTIATLFKSRVQPGILDQLWYLTAVSALCPFVAVLGARRGRLLEWSLFIVLPLIVVLEWPALAQLTRCWHGQRLELETPALIAFGVVMLMSMGNYAVDLNGLSLKAILWIGTWGFLVFGLAPGVNWMQLSGENLPQVVAIVVFQITVWQYVFAISQRNSRYLDWDRVWLDYQKFFGTVWTLRLMARINEVAQRDQWPWRLTPNGMQPATHDAPHPGSSTADPRVDQTFRWLLKPFVDSEWIDERLTASTVRAAGG